MDQIHTQKDPLLHPVNANAEEKIKKTLLHISLNFGLNPESLSYLELHRIHCIQYNFTSSSLVVLRWMDSGFKLP